MRGFHFALTALLGLVLIFAGCSADKGAAPPPLCGGAVCVPDGGSSGGQGGNSGRSGSGTGGSASGSGGSASGTAGSGSGSGGGTSGTGGSASGTGGSTSGTGGSTSGTGGQSDAGGGAGGSAGSLGTGGSSAGSGGTGAVGSGGTGAAGSGGTQSIPRYTLVVDAPANQASVQGTVTVRGRGPGFLNVEVWDATHTNPPLARATPSADGAFTTTVNTSTLTPGATTWTVYGWDSPAGQAFNNTARVTLNLTIVGP